LILTIIGLIYDVKNWKRSKKTIELLSISLFYLLVMILYRNKDARFIEPLTPIFVILICFWIIQLKNLLVRRSLITILVLLSLFNYYISSFGFVKIPDVLESKIFGADIVWYKQYGYTTGLPQKENWHLKEIINEITDSPALIILSEDKMFLNVFNLKYYQSLYAGNLNIDTVIGNNGCKNPIPDYNFIVINDNPEGDLAIFCKVALKDFYIKREFLLPDNSVAMVFKKKSY
jgi:hypothetical protein